MSRLPTTVHRWASRPARLLAAGTLLASTVLGGGLAAAPQPVAAASAAPIYWGAYIDNAPYDISLVDTFNATIGKPESIVHWGEAWETNGQFQPFETNAMQAVRSRGEIPMLTWGSWQLGYGENQPNFTDVMVASGAYDSFITQWAQSAKAWGQPFFLRFDHEMNGSWQFPWVAQGNGNTPADYVNMWRHVHDIFTQVGANNATWVWCPNIVGNSTTPLNQLYPGDNYVDWTCMDGYNWGTDSSGNVWQSFEQVFGGATYGGYNPHNSYQELLKVAPSKPIMLGEIASAENGGSKAAWITDMLQNMPTVFPQIKAFVWNDSVDGSNWQVNSSPSSQAAFVAGITNSVYTSNQFGASTGKVPVPGVTGSSTTPTPAQPTSTTNTLTLNPVADTWTNSKQPTSTAGGSSTELVSDLQGSYTSFLRFDLTPLAGKTIKSATLRLHSSTEGWAGSYATFDINLVGSVDWKEQYMSSNNTVPISPYVLGQLVAPTNPNTWYQASLNPASVQTKTGGLISMAMYGVTGDAFFFYSREAGASLAPQLVITYQ